ncbi:MAG: hypothetical protein QM499_05580 [Flavobacteriaceae bacterium]
MKNTILILLIAFSILSCNSVKQNQQYIAKGDYNKAIDLAVKKLQKDKTSSKSEEHILLLQEAFSKAVAQDKRKIEAANKGFNPAKPQIIYHLYTGLEKRQQKIRPLLPLYSNSLGKNAKFKLENYLGKLTVARENYVDYLYEIGNSYLGLNNTLDARMAYDSFKELNNIYPNFKDTKTLLDEAYFQGTDFVLVTLQNNTYKIIPRLLEENLLSFNATGLDDFWTVYHSIPQENINYNFRINLDFVTIEFSPERISEKEFERKKRVKDGWEYQKDRNGNFILDDEGNKIKKDVYIAVTATVNETIQTKSVLVKGDVIYFNLIENREIDHFPLLSEFIFENIFSTFRGDERALDPNDKINSKNKFVYFPSDEQMLIDASEGIKGELVEIIYNNNLRRNLR